MMEASTREAYTYQLGKHIMPWFGPMRMNEIMPSDVREWVTQLRQKRVSPDHPKSSDILSAIFTAALNDVTYLHPVQGREDPHRPEEAAERSSPRSSSTRIYHGRSRRAHHEAAHGDRHRDRPAMG